MQNMVSMVRRVIRLDRENFSFLHESKLETVSGDELSDYGLITILNLEPRLRWANQEGFYCAEKSLVISSTAACRSL